MQRDEVLERLAQHRGELSDLGVKSLALFGSMVRDESSEKSDVDLLVEFDRPVGLLKFIRVQRYLTELLESRVDLVTLDALKPKMREEVLAEAIHAAGVGCVGLLGTRFTMEQDFYRGRLAERHGLDVVVPNESDRTVVHDIIYEELCVGTVKEESKRAALRVIDDLVSRGAEGVVLGCTELPLLLRSADASVRLFDTTAIHAARAVELALSVEDC